MTLRGQQTVPLFCRNISGEPNARLTLLPVPLEHSTHSLYGLQAGPQALLDASRGLEDLEPDLGLCLRDYTLSCRDPLELQGLHNEESLRLIQKSTSEILSLKSWPLLIGGERTLSLGAIRALKASSGDFGVLSLSAEASFRQDFEGSRYSRRCLNRRIFEEQLPLVIAGLRSLSLEESEDLLHLGVPILRPTPFRRAGVELLQGFLPKRVYLALDLGVMDPSQIPGTGSCEPNGLLWNELCDFLDLLFESFDVIGADITELRPLKEEARSEAIAARLARRLAALHFRSQKQKH